MQMKFLTKICWAGAGTFPSGFVQYGAQRGKGWGLLAVLGYK